jgi:hypothetical protein
LDAANSTLVSITVPKSGLALSASVINPTL